MQKLILGNKFNHSLAPSHDNQGLNNSATINVIYRGDYDDVGCDNYG